MFFKLQFGGTFFGLTFEFSAKSAMKSLIIILLVRFHRWQRRLLHTLQSTVVISWGGVLKARVIREWGCSIPASALSLGISTLIRSMPESHKFPLCAEHKHQSHPVMYSVGVYTPDTFIQPISKLSRSVLLSVCTPILLFSQYQTKPSCSVQCGCYYNLYCLNVCLFPFHPSPWYDLRGWLGVKQQLSIYPFAFHPLSQCVPLSLSPTVWVCASLPFTHCLSVCLSPFHPLSQCVPLFLSPTVSVCASLFYCTNIIDIPFCTAWVCAHTFNAQISYYS